MKRYLLDLHRLRHNPYNGLYSFSCSLAESLLDLAASDEKFYFYLPAEKFGMFGNKPEYVTHKRLHKFFQFGTSKFDVWHLTTGISQYKPFNTKTKVVYTIHDVNFLIEEPNNVKQTKRTLQLMQKNIDRADHIVFISKFAREFASGYLDFNNKQTSIIYNGYSIKEYPAFNEPVYSPSKPFLFSVSLVQPRKNFHVLPSLLVGNDYELVIAGLNHFDYSKKIMEEASKFNVQDRVKLIGAVDEEHKYWYLKNCEAFMFPSIAEGFGIPPLEAMHFGKPVFLSDQTSLPEVGGEAAYYFSNFDPAYMQNVFKKGLTDYKENKRKESIIAHAKKFSWAKSANDYLSVYRQLL